MQGWACRAAAGVFVGTALACAGARDAAHTQQVTGRWACSFETTSDDGGPRVTLRFGGDSSYLERGALDVQGVLRATIETKDAPPAVVEWDAALKGTWSVKDGALCSTVTDARFTPKGVAPSKLAQRLADREPGDLLRIGSCDRLIEISERTFVASKADGTTVTCRRRP